MTGETDLPSATSTGWDCLSVGIKKELELDSSSVILFMISFTSSSIKFALNTFENWQDEINIRCLFRFEMPTSIER